MILIPHSPPRVHQPRRCLVCHVHSNINKQQRNSISVIFAAFIPGLNLADERYQLPGCQTHGKTYEEPIAQGQDAIDTWVYGENPATLPKPQFYQLDTAIAQNKNIAS